jgi:hypothetical protein
MRLLDGCCIFDPQGYKLPNWAFITRGIFFFFLKKTYVVCPLWEFLFPQTGGQSEVSFRRFKCETAQEILEGDQFGAGGSLPRWKNHAWP